MKITLNLQTTIGTTIPSIELSKDSFKGFIFSPYPQASIKIQRAERRIASNLFKDKSFKDVNIYSDHKRDAEEFNAQYINDINQVISTDKESLVIFTDIKDLGSLQNKIDYLSNLDNVYFVVFDYNAHLSNIDFNWNVPELICVAEDIVLRYNSIDTKIFVS